MNMNKEWQNRQEKHIPPESQSSLESLNTNNKTERKSRSNKEALNLHFRITGWMSKVNIVDVLNFCKYYKKIFIIYVIHCNIVRNIVVYLWLINQLTLSRVYITALQHYICGGGCHTLPNISWGPLIWVMGVIMAPVTITSLVSSACVTNGAPHLPRRQIIREYRIVFWVLSSSGPGPGQVKVRWRSGEGHEGQSEVCVRST